jgi:hypothetical protein
LGKGKISKDEFNSEQWRFNIMEQKEPVIIFQDDDQFMEYLRYWQNKLFLNDWVIRGKLCSFDELNEPSLDGYNIVIAVSKTADIKILNELPNGNDVAKFCAEITLVHELLHCKYGMMKYEFDQYANRYNRYMDVCEHTLLEQMAKTLIMVKYNLPFEFFYKD